MGWKGAWGSSVGSSFGHRSGHKGQSPEHCLAGHLLFCWPWLIWGLVCFVQFFWWVMVLFFKLRDLQSWHPTPPAFSARGGQECREPVVPATAVLLPYLHDAHSNAHTGAGAGAWQVAGTIQGSRLLPGFPRKTLLQFSPSTLCPTSVLTSHAYADQNFPFCISGLI